MVTKESTTRTGTPLPASTGLIRYYNPDPVILSSEPMLELSPTARMLLSQNPRPPDRGFLVTAFSSLRQIRRHPIEFVRFHRKRWAEPFATHAPDFSYERR